MGAHRASDNKILYGNSENVTVNNLICVYNLSALAPAIERYISATVYGASTTDHVPMFLYAQSTMHRHKLTHTYTEQGPGPFE